MMVYIEIHGVDFEKEMTPPGRFQPSYNIDFVTDIPFITIRTNSLIEFHPYSLLASTSALTFPSLRSRAQTC